MKDLICNIEIKKVVEVETYTGGIYYINLSELSSIFNPKDIRLNSDSLPLFYDRDLFNAAAEGSFYNRDTNYYMFKTAKDMAEVYLIAIDLVICLTSGISRRLKIDLQDSNSYEALYSQAFSTSMAFNQTFENIVYGALTSSIGDLTLINNDGRFSPIMDETIDTERGVALFYRLETIDGESFITSLAKGYLTKCSQNKNNIGFMIENFLSQLDKPLYAGGTYEKSMPVFPFSKLQEDADFKTPRLFGANAPIKVENLNRNPTLGFSELSIDLNFDAMYEGFQLIPDLGVSPFFIYFSTIYISEEGTIDEQLGREILISNIFSIGVGRDIVWLTNSDDLKYFVVGDVIVGETASIPNVRQAIVESYAYDDITGDFGVIVYSDFVSFSATGKVLILALNGVWAEDTSAPSGYKMLPLTEGTQYYISNNCLVYGVDYSVLPAGFLNNKSKLKYKYKNIRDMELNNHALVALEILRTEFKDSEIDIQSFIDASEALSCTVSIANTINTEEIITKKEALRRLFTSAMTYIYINKDQKISYGIINKDKPVDVYLNENDISKGSMSFSWENEDSYNTGLVYNKNIGFNASIKDLKQFALNGTEKIIESEIFIDIREYAREIILAESILETEVFGYMKNAISILSGRKMRLIFECVSNEKEIKLGDKINITHNLFPNGVECLAVGVNSNVKTRTITAIRIMDLSDNLLTTLNNEEVGE